MQKILIAALIGTAALAASSAASAHVDVAIGLGIPGVVYEAPPVIYAPPQVVTYGYPYGYQYGYGGGDGDWREHEWHRREWRERHWRHHHGDDDD
jgi:hypothetical protein